MLAFKCKCGFIHIITINKLKANSTKQIISINNEDCNCYRPSQLTQMNKASSFFFLVRGRAVVDDGS